jgi:poly-gamma-glutamate synthesis protein (capsule biosynthesis protein)
MASGLIRPGADATADRAGLNQIHLSGGTPNLDAGRPDAADIARNLQSIREAASHADLVVAYQHNHVYDKDFVQMMLKRMPERLAPPPWIRTWAHQQVEAGADVVVLHGAPLVQGVEIYRGRPIFYDLGNFIFQLPLKVDRTGLFEADVWESVVARANFRGRTLTSVTFVPIALNKDGRGEGQLALATRGLPAPAHGAKAHEILQRLVEASRPFGTTILIRGDTAELVLNSSPPAR